MVTGRLGDWEIGRRDELLPRPPVTPSPCRLVFPAVVLLFLLVLAFAPTPSQAQEAGSFARMGFGARGIAMGNALVADADSVASPYYNPALAPFVEQQRLEASAAFLTFDRELQFLQFAAPIRPRAGIAAGLTHAGVSNIDGRDESGYHDRTLSVDEYAFFLAFGTHIGSRLTGGATFKYYYADYLDTIEPVEGLGLDLGLTARLSQRLYLGLAVSDLLARYAWDTSGAYAEGGRQTTDRFPVRLRFGASYQADHARLVGELEARFSPRERPNGEAEVVPRGFARVGGAYRLAEPFTLRAGIDRIGGGETLRGVRPSVGFGLDEAIGQLRLNASYAFAWETRINDPMHLVTLQLFL